MPRRRGEIAVAVAASIVVSLVAVWLSLDMEIMATDSPLDDELFLRKAESTVWFGNESYSKAILFKEPTYSLFVAFGYRLGVPLRLAHEFFYLAAAGFLACSLTYRQSRPWVGFVVFAAIALYPMHFTSFQRAGHSSLYISLVVLTPAAFIWQWKRQGEARVWLRWLLSGLALGLLLNTRQERPLAALLIIPFITASFVYMWRSTRRHGAALRRWCFDWIPPLGVALFITLALAYGNYRRWGVYAGSDLQASSFKAAYQALLSIKPEQPIPYVPITRDMLEKAYSVSPSCKKLAPFFENDVEPHSRTWNYIQDVPPGEYSGGWFVTALRAAVEHAGYYRTGRETDLFYSQIGKELRDSAKFGRIKTRWLPPGVSWVIHPYPGTYFGNLIPSWRTLWHHSWAEVWQYGPSPASGLASAEVEELFDRVASRRRVEQSETQNKTRNLLWTGFTYVMEPMLAVGFFIAGVVVWRARRTAGWTSYMLPSVAFGSYGFAAFVIFTIIDASTIPTRDYLFPAILTLVIAAVWSSVEGVRLLVQKPLVPRPRYSAFARPCPQRAVLIVSACMCFSLLLGAQWVYGRTRPPDTVEEVGRLEKVDKDSIKGWARIRNRPKTPVQVEIYVDGVHVSTVDADQDRDDLAESHIGTGKHGFRMETPDILKDGNPHTVDAKIVGTNYRLADTPMTVTLTDGNTQ